jgi:nicotinamidase-related amidase
MPKIQREHSTLLIVDFQSRLMPAIEDGKSAIINAQRLLAAANLFELPVLFTEQNAKGLGGTVHDLRPEAHRIVHKMTFDACRADGFMEALGQRPEVIVAGCETHVCVLQTVLGLLDAGRRVYIVRDAVGSRRVESKETGIRRMERNGAEVVTTEMVLFEWLGSADDSRLDNIIALVK